MYYRPTSKIVKNIKKIFQRFNYDGADEKEEENDDSDSDDDKFLFGPKRK